jgi:hypothetical protein
MLEVALARIRQLSAHEVGHTIGFEHNFAASTQDRASVMDYPFPLVTFDKDGELDFSDAYDDAIGNWDKRTVLYAYQDFADGADANVARREIIEETIKLGYRYVADVDARSASTAHPEGNVWDNGADALAELEHLMKLRAHALARMSAETIRIGRPLATLEEALVPVYLLHRFQLPAVGKLIGGQNFKYAMRGDGQAITRPVSAERQQAAIDALLATLDPAVLRLPDGLAAMIPPRPPAYPKTRETFTGHTGHLFDAMAPAASAVALTLDVLLDPARAARLQRGDGPAFSTITNGLLQVGWFGSSGDAAMQRMTGSILLQDLMRLSANTAADIAVRADALAAIDQLDNWLANRTGDNAATNAHYGLARLQIERFRQDPASVESLPGVTVPPGSPIGADGAMPWIQ